MNDFFKAGLTIVGAIIVLAIISVIISKKSQAPQAIQAVSSGLARIVQAAVSPSTNLNNGDLGRNALTGSPQQSQWSISDLWKGIPGFKS